MARGGVAPMESIITFICNNAHDAHWIIFLLLMLAGLNVPISEDLMLLTGGAIAGTCIPEHKFHLYAWIYMGCWLSAWEAYWIGRLLGPKLYEIRWFSKFITRQRIEKLQGYYEKFGIFTFMVGRFCPGGVRNALFITSGLGKMPFLTFIARDGFSCLISSATLFYLGYVFGEHHDAVLSHFKTYEEIVLGAILAIILTICAVVYYRKKKLLV